MSPIIHPNDDLHERMIRYSNAVVWEYREAVKCVYGVANDDKIRPVGSCIPIEVNGQHFLLTAAHVLDNMKYAKLLVNFHRQPLIIPPTGGIIIPPGGDRSKDMLDFGWVLLDGQMLAELKDCRFFTSSDLSVNSSPYNDYLIYGYPLSRNKPRIALGEINSKPLLYTMTRSRREGPFIYVQYGDMSSYPDMEDLRAPVDPRGMSGGALIDMGSLQDWENLITRTESSNFRGKIAGMITEKVVRKEKGQKITEIRCTDMRFIFDVIKNYI